MCPINFYKTNEEYGCLSNFAAYPVQMNGKVWPTSEHYYQAQKFAGTEDEENIRKTPSPTIAKRMGSSKKKPLRTDWECVKNDIMYEVVLAKFTQHPEIRDILLSTGDEQIAEHTERDRYWGDGGDGSGKNMLGKTLMKVRDELRKSQESALS